MYIKFRIQASFEIFNFGSKLWRAGGGLLNTRRYMPALYIFKNKLTVFGGVANGGNYIPLERFFPYIFFQGQNLAYIVKLVILTLSQILTPTENIGKFNKRKI